jgi:hypothetical protein
MSEKSRSCVIKKMISRLRCLPDLVIGLSLQVFSTDCIEIVPECGEFRDQAAREDSRRTLIFTV